MNPSVTGLGTISPSPSFEEFKISEIDSLKDHESHSAKKSLTTKKLESPDV